MTNLDSILFDLLVHHNCVIIPEFGGFIAKRISSQIDYEKGIVHPPSKHLLFNRFLTADDGLLISSFVQVGEEDYDVIKMKLSVFVSELDKKLSNGEEVTFKHIGTLKRSDNGNYSFKQDRSFNLLADAYGLKELDFVSAKEVEEELEPVVSELPLVVEAKQKKTIGARKLLRYAAAACILPLAFYSFWIPFKSDFFSSGLISIDDFNPFYTKEAGLYEPVPSKHIITEQKSIEKKPEEIRVIEHKTIEREFTNVDKAEDIGSAFVGQPTSVYNRYYIVGCFSVKQNADNFLIKLRQDGFDPLIVGGGKLYRVTVGQSENKKEFNALLALAKNKGYKGWTLKK